MTNFETKQDAIVWCKAFAAARVCIMINGLDYYWSVFTPEWLWTV